MSRLSDGLVLSEDPVTNSTGILIEISNKTISESHLSKKKLPNVPWFNDGCKQVIKERKKAQQKLFHNPTDEYSRTVKQPKAKAKRINKKKIKRKIKMQNVNAFLYSNAKFDTV